MAKSKENSTNAVRQSYVWHMQAERDALRSHSHTI